MRQTWVTTEDNPFDPFTQFDDWDRYDRDSGYHTCRYIAGLAQTSNALSEAENEAEIEEAVDRICMLNVLRNYVKVVREVEDEGETIPESD